MPNLVHTNFTQSNVKTVALITKTTPQHSQSNIYVNYAIQHTTCHFIDSKQFLTSRCFFYHFFSPKRNQTAQNSAILQNSTNVHSSKQIVLIIFALHY